MSNFLDLPQEQKKFLQKHWKALSGQKNWEGLLSPLDEVLRRYILHYGEMSQSTYDAFNPRYAGGCLFAESEFFNGVGLNFGHPPLYTVTNYIYATSSIGFRTCFSINSSNWLGYIAVSTSFGTQMLGRRDIVISLRGTVRAAEWIKNLEFKLVKAPEIFHSYEPKVHYGWHSLYTSANEDLQYCKTSARQQILVEVRKLVEAYKTEETSITICGHSLGGAVATLVAADIILNKYNVPNHMAQKHCMVTAFLFASPKVGDWVFGDLVSRLNNLHVLRVRNVQDVVPWLPPFCFEKVGQVLEIDTCTSDYVWHIDPISSHNLEVYLHLVAELWDCNERTKPTIKRDHALMNKHGDILRHEYGIPAAWWSPSGNKGMVRQRDGTWKLK